MFIWTYYKMCASFHWGTIFLAVKKFVRDGEFYVILLH